MKASQISTVNRNSKTIVSSLAALAVLTFFVAGPADARCRDRVRQVQIESRIVTAQDRFVQDLGTDYRDLSHVPHIEVLGRNRSLVGRTDVRRDRVRRPVNLRGLGQVKSTTVYQINDTDYDRRKAERQEQRRRIIEGLKGAGVIREPGQPATTTATTTKPKPIPKPVLKPTRKPQPKVTKLPNGDQITEYPDGLRVVKMKDGGTVSTYPDGKRVVTNANGDTTVTEPNGYRKTTNRYGDGTAHFPDGTRIDFKASGEATLTSPDGKKYHRMPGKGFKEVD